jgi:hypothetical protein
VVAVVVEEPFFVVVVVVVVPGSLVILAEARIPDVVDVVVLPAAVTNVLLPGTFDVLFVVGNDVATKDDVGVGK